MDTGQTDFQVLSDTQQCISWKQLEIAKMFSALETDEMKTKFEV